jgi:hypothetical protein
MANQILDRVRRNHALEHATINVLTQRHKGFSAQGNSTPWGFHLNIYGPMDEEKVAAAVDEAYDRLQKGEAGLALHPSCGTVLLTTATMAALAAQVTFGLERRRQNRPHFDLPVLLGAMPMAILSVTVALISSRPVGMSVQRRFTVDPHLGDLQVTSVRKVPPSPVTRLFQFLLGQARNDQAHSFRVETAG